ncbi:unnamed protein product, partial [Brassica rapa subsp. trilocularis]
TRDFGSAIVRDRFHLSQRTWGGLLLGVDLHPPSRSIRQRIRPILLESPRFHPSINKELPPYEKGSSPLLRDSQHIFVRDFCILRFTLLL